MTTGDRAAVVLPIRSFIDGNTRLAAALGPRRRRSLAVAMATRVRAAAGDLPCTVVTGDAEVAAWAGAVGAQVLPDPGGGLNAALAAADVALAGRGVQRLVVVPADLPLADDLAWLATTAWPVLLVTDRAGTGTNALALPSGLGWRWAFGAASRTGHVREAHRHGLACAVLRDPLLSWDVDTGHDLPWPRARPVARRRRAAHRRRGRLADAARPPGAQGPDGQTAR